MPNTGLPTDGHSSDLATNRTKFPSRENWERWWEKVVDLEWLRANRSSAELISRLIELRPGDDIDLWPDRVSLCALVDAAQLEETAAAQLLRDVMVIEAWYHLPQRRLRLGLENSVEALEKAAALARDLHIMLDANAVAVEDLVDPVFPAGEDSLDLLELSRQVGKFHHAAREALVRAQPGHGGRKPDDRRNITIILITQAIEEALDEKVAISRGSSKEDWRFTNRAGWFVRDFMAVLGWRDERVLVGAFDKLRRRRAVKQ